MWRNNGTWQIINHVLLMDVREAAGREASLTAGAIDRFFRRLKEEIVQGRISQTIGEVRDASAASPPATMPSG